METIVVWDGDGPEFPGKRLDGVRYVSTGGRAGTPTANNVGLEAATGDFIARLDADDVSLPGRLKAQVATLQANPTAVLCVTNARVIDQAGRAVGPYPRTASSALPRLLLRKNPLLHSSFMFRRSPLRYDVRCIRMQDYEIAMRAAAMGPIAVVDDVLVEYRVHPAQTGRQVKDFWKYIPVILQGRRRLARSLSRSRLLQCWHDLAWFAAQYLNKLGLRDRYKGLRPSRA
jgi:glycosyltransferase involved in cell wall biosynthesis